MLKHRLRRIPALLALCALLISMLALPASAAAFGDVPEGHWAEEEISRCVEKGFFKGQAEGHFGLGEPMTRSAFTVVLSRFFGWETPAPAKATYPDVPVSAWYAGAVQAAFDHGALTRQAGEFRPAEPVTRQEMTVMLLRALGYSDLAGLSLEQACPFHDVTENEGYITLAYHLGLMNGTSSTTFAPDRFATREQVAVIFMRLYDKLHTPAPEKTALLAADAPVPDLTGYEAAAIPAATLLYISGAPALRPSMPEEARLAMKEAVVQSAAKPYLYVTAVSNVLGGSIEDAAEVLASAVAEGGYDGLVLDFPRLQFSRAAQLNALAAALDSALGDKTFCLMTEAPALGETRYDGYDFAALSASADQLILRFAPYERKVGSLMMAPPQAPEQICFALSALKTAGVPAGKAALLLDPDPVLWYGGTRAGETPSAEELQALLDEGSMTMHYSPHFACTYLAGTERDNANHIVWLPDGRGAAERAQLLQLFGGGQIWLSRPHTASADFLSGLN